ncbi:MAG: tyrosine-type recombinase/integrase [Candidatus Hodarchaeota archaeon]
MKVRKTKYPGIYKIGSNYYIDYYAPDGKRHREVVGPLLADAVKKKADIKDQMRRGKYFAERKKFTTTFDELVEKYQELKKDRKYFQTEGKFIEIFKKFFGGKLLSQITPLDIHQFKSKRKGTPTWHGKERSDATVNRELACLRHIFNMGVEWDLMEENPFPRKRFLFRENNKRTRYLTEEEIQKLLDACSPHLKPIVITALYTGLRKGEILKLRWEDVNLDEGLIYIRENKANRLQIKEMNDDLLLLFASLPVKGKYVFHDRDGKPFKDIKTAFKTALRRSRIKDFRFHDLRHTSCSYLMMRGAVPQAVQEHAGHKSVSMTMRYSHLSPRYRRQSVQLLNGLCKTALEEICRGYSETIVKKDSRQEVPPIATA